MDFQPIKGDWLQACGFKVEGDTALRVLRRYMLGGWEWVDVIDPNGHEWKCIEWRFAKHMEAN